ncbi:hypothetical protein [Ensifer sp. ENS08]|uniref:hypothetical protein n=1 Tax=Ensifer sp. ENS08 TaxID=2769273 RepID=UPI00177F5D82|nr:hypothetical protein [Ensifer sp. ENS08]MBD9569008.1 hypothetical protein [Ensifer sp. ENS08]
MSHGRTILIALSLMSTVTSALAQENPINEGFGGIVIDPKTKSIAVEVQDLDGANALTVDPKTHPGTIAAFPLGGEDIYTYFCRVFEMPQQMLDVDGGTIRLIMQHELDPYDQMRMIDEHIATEWSDDTYGKRGRYAGRYGWTRQSGGGDYSWVLGDQVAHNIAAPWGWIWIDDFARFGNGQLLGGNKVQMCVHPHVTARVFLRD